MMWEVFNYITGETVGFTDDKLDAWRRVRANASLDLINADRESADFISHDYR
jgi:hypothetical protein